MNLTGKKIALVATDGFENVELFSPRQALLDAGAAVEVVSTKPGTIQGYNEFEMADSIAVDRLVKEVTPAAYDALLLPGGTINGDKLRGDADVLVFVRGMADAGKPIAAICHAPWVLIDAGIASGRKLTSYPTIRLDLENAGAVWTNEAAVIDGNLLTSRDPDDLPSFNRAMVVLVSDADPQRFFLRSL